MKRGFKAAGVMLVFLGGCSSWPALNSSVNHNIAVQTVDPSAPHPDAHMDMNGERESVGQKNYLADKVAKPAEPDTSGSKGGGGGNGSQGGGEGASSQ